MLAMLKSKPGRLGHRARIRFINEQVFAFRLLLRTTPRGLRSVPEPARVRRAHGARFLIHSSLLPINSCICVRACPPPPPKIGQWGRAETSVTKRLMDAEGLLERSSRASNNLLATF